jgi:ACS family D-galactonate transporter-like MFS transporter
MLCQSTQALVLGGIALFLPLIRTSFGITFAQAGLISATSVLIYAFMQVPSGYLADRVSPKRLFAAGLLGTNLLALSFAHLHSFQLVLVNQAASGFFRAFVFAPGLLLMTALFPADRRATALGLFVAAGFSSSFFLNMLGPLLVGPLGWRNLFTIFALGGLGALALFWRLGPEVSPRADREPLRHASLSLLRRKALWLIAVIQYVRYALVSSITTWIPSFVVYDRGHSLKVAGLIVATGALLTAPSNFLGGFLSDRLRSPMLVIGSSLGVLSALTFALARVHELAAVVIVIALTFVFLQFYFGPLFAFPIELFGSANAGFLSGFANLFANVGGFTFIFFLGAIKDSTGTFSAGFYALSGLALVGLVCVAALAAVTRGRGVDVP